MTSEVHPVEHWEADVLLKDGRVAQLRPILEEDAERLVEFYSRVSEQSKYFRFFAPYPTLSDKDVTRFTTVDNDRRVAFVVTLHSTIIGVGRCRARPSADVNSPLVTGAGPVTLTGPASSVCEMANSTART